MYKPSLEKVRELASSGNVIPVCRSMLADLETPVSVWLKIFQESEYSFILESVSGGDSAGRYSFIGGDPFLIFRANGTKWTIKGREEQEGEGSPIEKLRELLSRYNPVKYEGLPRFCGGAVGYCGYDTVRLTENIPDKNPKEDSLDEMMYAFYDKVIVFDNREHCILLVGNVFAQDGCDIEENYNSVIRELGTLEDRLSVSLRVAPGLSIKKAGKVNSNVKRDEFESAVEKCREYIRAGDIFQVVLSQRFSLELDASAFDIYRALRTINPSPYMFFLSCGETAVVGASPEMLVRVEGEDVEVRPIAGTRPRGETLSEDEDLEKELLADSKEISEHVMLVDLGRNDVGRVSRYGSVMPHEMMHIERFSHVMHIVTNVKGKLREDRDSFDALASCFPAGTLSGAPKIRAMEIIDELENVKRSIYGGALGYIDFSGNLDSCIVIRTVIVEKDKAWVQAGAGIVADSVPAKEYDETVNKASALFKAIEDAAGRYKV